MGSARGLVYFFLVGFPRCSCWRGIDLAIAAALDGGCLLNLRASPSPVLPPYPCRCPCRDARTGRWDVALGETHTLLVNGNGHVLVLVSIDADDHVNSADDFATDNCSHFCLLKDSASARRADKTAKRLEVSCYEVTAPMAVGSISAISGSSRQIIWNASGPVSDLSACVVQFNPPITVAL